MCLGHARLMKLVIVDIVSLCHFGLFNVKLTFCLHEIGLVAS